MHHLLDVGAEVHELLLVVLGLVLVLLVQESLVEVASVQPLEVALECERDVHHVHVEGRNDFVLVEELDLEHVHELIIVEALPVSEHVVELVQERLLEFLGFTELSLVDFLVEPEQVFLKVGLLHSGRFLVL